MCGVFCLIVISSHPFLLSVDRSVAVEVHVLVFVRCRLRVHRREGRKLKIADGNKKES